MKCGGLTTCGVVYTIDTRDYVNGIGNSSHEPYIRACTPCYSLHSIVRRANRKLANKCPKIMTAVHLSIDDSKTKGV